MTTKERARAMRAERQSFASIARRLGVSLQYAHKCAGDVEPAEPQDTTTTVIRYAANNDGYPQAVRLPRIPTLDGAYASNAA